MNRLALGALALSLSAQLSVASNPDVGDPAPPTSVEDLLGAPGEGLSALEALEGSAVVLEFWATWCGPCVGAIPHLNELHDALEGEPIQFISVTDEDRSTVEAFLNKRQIDGWVGLDTDRSLFDAYGVRAIPHTVLIDRDGVIRGRTHASLVTEDRLRALISGRALDLPDRREGGDMSEIALGDEGPEPVFQALLRPSTSDAGAVSVSSNQLRVVAGTVRSLIQRAWGVDAHNLEFEVEEPEQRYDAVVRVNDSDHRNKLLRMALEDGLGVIAEWRTRERPVYLLQTTGRTSALLPEGDVGGGLSFRPGQIEGMNMPISSIASFLENGLERDVIDQTGLEGRYDISLRWESGNRDALIRAVREQLGLRLVEARRDVQVLVVTEISP